jgi:hypothetical protein
MTKISKCCGSAIYMAQACVDHDVQAAGCSVLRLDLSNSLLGMALVLGSLASMLTSMQLGSAFLFAAWAAAALLGMPAAGRVRLAASHACSTARCPRLF